MIVIVVVIVSVIVSCPVFMIGMAKVGVVNSDCGGVCHGTMTGWFNNRFRGAALTVEYGAHPARRRRARTH